MGNTTKKAFPVLNMHCAGCANNVEKTVKKLPGVIEASVNFATNTLTVSYEKECNAYAVPLPGVLLCGLLPQSDHNLPQAQPHESLRESAALYHKKRSMYWSVDFGSTIVGIFHDTDACAIL